MKETNDSRNLAALAVFRSLYDSKKSISTIISEFIKEILKTNELYSTNVTQIRELLKSEYDFTIPDAVVEPSLKKLCKKENGMYIVKDKSFVNNSTEVTKKCNEIKSYNDSIIKEIIKFVENETFKKLSDDEKDVLSHSFCSFLIDESTDIEYSDYISAFIIKNKDDKFISEQLQSIKEGVVLYTGIKYNDSVNNIGSWSSEITIYLEQEILFHFAGYNGELCKVLFEDFYVLVREINQKAITGGGKKLVKLKYFPEVRTEIEKFFNTAERILEGNEIQDHSKTAMMTIIKGCSNPSDILTKKAQFFTLLQTNSIHEECYEDYFKGENTKYNIESDDLIKKLQNEFENEDFVAKLKFINYINILRKGINNIGFENCKYILLSGNSTTFKLTSHDEIKINGNVPHATFLNFITNKFWFKLNKGFGGADYPRTFDLITKAQIVLSSHLNNTVSADFNSLKEKKREGKMTEEDTVAILAELKNRIKKPEEIDAEEIDNILTTIKESDIENHLRERELERKKADEQSKLNEKLSKDLILEKKAKQDTIDQLEALKVKSESESKIAQLNLRLEYLEENKQSIEEQIVKIDNRKKMADKKVQKQLKYIWSIPLIITFLFSILIAVLIIKLTWNVMEPITYMITFIYPIFIYIIYAVKGKSFNPKKFIEVDCKTKIENKIYKELDIDINDLKMYNDKKNKIIDDINLSLDELAKLIVRGLA